MTPDEIEKFFLSHLGKKVKLTTAFIDKLHNDPNYKGLPWSTWAGIVSDIDVTRGEIIAYTIPETDHGWSIGGDMQKWPKAFSIHPSNLCEVNDELIEENQRLKAEEIKRLEVNLTIPNLSQENIDKIETRMEKLILSNKNESYYDI